MQIFIVETSQPGQSIPIPNFHASGFPFEYAKTALNPEPYAYESGFSVKWLIEQQIKGDPALNFDPKHGAVKVPWLSWGPYLWANGSTKRTDGFSYEAGDFSAGDGTHQSPAGQEKTGRLLLQFLKTDATARPWFVRR